MTDTDQLTAVGGPLHSGIDDVDNPSMMLQKPGLFFRIVGRLFFREVSFPEQCVQKVKQAAENGNVVYVLQHHSQLDYLYFNYACLRHGLPLSRFANAVNTVLFRPLWSMVRFVTRYLFGATLPLFGDTPRFFRQIIEAQQPAMVFLKTPRQLAKGFVEDKTDYLDVLIRIQQTSHQRLFVVPQLLTWRLNPDRDRRSVADLVFGDPNAPGRLRKIMHFLVNHKRAFVKVCEPVDLREFLGAHDALTDPGELAEHLRFRLHQQFVLEQKVIKGPVLKRARRLKEEILDNQELHRQILDLSESTGESPDDLHKRARTYLNEIAADFRIGYIEAAFFLLNPLWRRMYTEFEIDDAGLERLKEAAKNGPVVLVPSHKSHVDYLVISFIFFIKGLVPPHIAAGKNLNFWPVGHFFRRSGAFFLRRQFRGLSLYSLIFKHYLRKLIKEGHHIEFFIEGGRSRSGRILPPKFGMLTMMVEAVLSGASRDVYFMPVSVGYDKLVEERSLFRELRGGEKKKENAWALLQTLRVITAKYGRLYLQLGEPISLRETVMQLGDAGADGEISADRDGIHRLGYEVVTALSQITTVTTLAVVATALLSVRETEIPRTELLGRCGFFVSELFERGARLSRSLQSLAPLLNMRMQTAERQSGLEQFVPVGEALGEPLSQALFRLSTERSIEIQDSDQTIYRVAMDRRINLDYYRNLLLTHFVDDAVVATAFARAAQLDDWSPAHVGRLAQEIAHLLATELFFGQTLDYAPRFDATVAKMCQRGILATTDDQQLRPTMVGDELLQIYRSLIANLFESYWVVYRTALQLKEGLLSTKGFIRRCQREFKGGTFTGTLRMDEGVSSANLRNALETLQAREIVLRRSIKEKRRRTDELELNHDKLALLERLTETLGVFRPQSLSTIQKEDA